MILINFEIDKQLINNELLGIEGALASFLNSALGFSPTLFLQLSRSCIPCMKFTSPELDIRPMLCETDFLALKGRYIPAQGNALGNGSERFS
jgi:hypothetical protein